MSRQSAVLVGSALLLFAAGPVWRAAAAAADDDEKSLAARESEETSRLVRAELPRWKLRSGDDRDHELTLNPKSVLRWTNPGVGRVYGDVYLWTRDGRPEAVIHGGNAFALADRPVGGARWHCALAAHESRNLAEGRS